ncbi:MAG: energy transducer TonB [Fluviicola sp.]
MKLLLLVLFIPLFSFSQEDTTIVDFPDVEASFPGGNVKMVQFISGNLEYPDTVDVDFVSKIYLSFIVESDGSISNIEMMNAEGSSLEKAYVNLIQKMPKWDPAELNGEAVRSRCRLPICINLQ